MTTKLKNLQRCGNITKHLLYINLVLPTTVIFIFTTFFNPHNILQEEYNYYPRFADEETEAQKE